MSFYLALDPLTSQNLVDMPRLGPLSLSSQPMDAVLVPCFRKVLFPVAYWCWERGDPEIWEDFCFCRHAPSKLAFVGQLGRWAMQFRSLW